MIRSIHLPSVRGKIFDGTLAESLTTLSSYTVTSSLQTQCHIFPTFYNKHSHHIQPFFIFTLTISPPDSTPATPSPLIFLFIHRYQANCMGCGTSLHPPPPIQPSTLLYDGMLLSFPPQKDIWLLHNGTKRAFPNMYVFDRIGGNLDMVLKV